jgi:predicted  nucleic acid-binding Zn-ribbon protein
MNPEIKALFDLQQRDRRLTALERRLTLIPTRVKELDDDIAKLSKMLASERAKCDDTRIFQRNQEEQLREEEDMLRNSRAKLGQVKNPRELNAIQREIEATRRMASSRSEEIEKIKGGVSEAEGRIAALTDSFATVQAQAAAEKERLVAEQQKLEGRLGKLRSGRSDLTEQIDKELLRTYDRIRRRVGGIAFVAAIEGQCAACKMHVPHQVYVSLRKGQEVPTCESCGRLLYWSGHFPKEEAKNEAKVKAAPPQRRPAIIDD